MKLNENKNTTITIILFYLIQKVNHYEKNLKKF